MDQNCPLVCNDKLLRAFNLEATLDNLLCLSLMRILLIRFQDLLSDLDAILIN